MKVYADNAATTKISKSVIEEMNIYMENVYGNPSSLYAIGQQAKDALEDARARVAKILNCDIREVYFTSGGSEADNQAIISAAKAGEKKGKKHIISTTFEHHAVLHTLKKLEREASAEKRPKNRHATIKSICKIRFRRAEILPKIALTP